MYDTKLTAGSINSVIHTYKTDSKLDANKIAQAQKASQLNSAFDTTIAGAEYYTNALPINTGVTNMGHIGILPFFNNLVGTDTNTASAPLSASIFNTVNTGANNLADLKANFPDFVAGDKGCLPILNLATVPQDVTAVKNGILAANSVGGSTEPIVSSNLQPWQIFGTTSLASSLTSSSGRILGGQNININGATGSGISVSITGNTKSVGTASDTVYQQPLHVAQQIAPNILPLQLAYNVFAAATGTKAAGAALDCSLSDSLGDICNNQNVMNAPLVGPNTYNPNLLANSQVNQVALDMAAIVQLFCITNGVCCIPTSPTVPCNADPKELAKSSTNQIIFNINFLLLSIVSNRLSDFLS